MGLVDELRPNHYREGRDLRFDEEPPDCTLDVNRCVL